MKKIYTYAMITACLFSFSLTFAQTPIITMIVDGDCSGGSPKVLEIYASGTVDFTNFSLQNQTNAGTTWGNTFDLSPLGTVTDDFVYVFKESTAGQFSSEFPSITDTVSSNTVNVNGDDRLRIINTNTSAVIDVYGVDGVDGSGEVWEYKDGYSKRINGSGPNATFTPAEWTFHNGDLDGLGLCQGGTATFESITGAGSYSATGSTTPTTSLSATSKTINEGSGTDTVTYVSINPNVTNPSSFEIHLIGGTGDISDITGFTNPTTVPVISSTTSLFVPVTPNDDALIEGTETLIFALRNATGDLTIGNDSIFTLTITDNDQTLIDIATASATGTNGMPANLDSVYRLSGVVNSPERGYNSMEFSMQDATGGITIYDNVTALTYEAAVGDSVEVIGKIGFRSGVVILTDIVSVNLLGQNATVSETLTTAPTDANESSLIRINDVFLRDISTWTTGSGGFGFEASAQTIAGDTFLILVDRDYTDLYNMAAPCDTFDIIGVASQFDTDSPYTESYQIIPRFLTDIIGSSPCPSATYSIADATEVDSDGDPLLFGTNITLKGIVTSPDFRATQNGIEFSFADATGGIWAYTSDSLLGLSYTPSVGDSVIITGNIGASNGVTRIYIDAISSPGTATAFSPVVVTTALDESHEAELIKIENLTLTGTWNSGPASFNVSAVSNNGITYDIRVDADRSELFNVPLTSSLTFNITGIGSQYDPSSPRTEGYQIMPRFETDIEISSALTEVNLSDLRIHPVPAKNNLTVSFDFDANETAQVALVDVTGRTLLNKDIQLSNGFNTTTLNVSNVNSGFYMVKIKTSKGISTSNIIVE